MVRPQMAIRIPRPHLLPLHLRELLWDDGPPTRAVAEEAPETTAASVSPGRACFDHAGSPYRVMNQ
jgi:hypothetical protein